MWIHLFKYPPVTNTIDVVVGSPLLHSSQAMSAQAEVKSKQQYNSFLGPYIVLMSMSQLT